MSSFFLTCDSFEAEAGRILDKGFVLPAYDYVLKSSHTFNLLDARGAVSVTERTGYIGRIRALASRCAAAYRKQREEMGFPFMGKFGAPARCAGAAVETVSELAEGRNA